MIRRLTAWITCLSYLLAAPLSVGASVICVGEDGHIAIEQAYNGSCSDSREKHDDSSTSLPSQGEQQIDADDSHCGPCTDFALLSNYTNVSKSSLDSSRSIEPQGEAQPLHVSACHLTFSTSHQADTQLSYSEPPISSSIRMLRSVVLLI